jgi:flagellar motor switch/type III secretory pathway protein FliN
MSAALQVRPFPWHALERTTWSEVHALYQVRRWASSYADLPRVASVLAGLLGARVEILLQRAQPLTGARGIPGGAAVVLAGAEAPSLERGMLIETDLALISRAVAQVTQRKPSRVLDLSASASPAAAGALGAIVVAALRRAHQGRGVRVLAAGPATVLEGDMTRLGLDLCSVTLTVLVGDDAYEARVVVPRSATLAVPPFPWGIAALAALDAIPLALPVVAHTLLTTATDLASLEPGDALVLDGWPLARDPAGSMTGPVRLSAPTSSMGVSADLVEDGLVVLRGEAVALCAAEAEMGDAVDRSSLIEAIGEVPVVLRVELGEARMAAREWAALGRGDVVTLGRRVGESVVLRVGGVPVARGDLVEIDGEVGVRIVERFAADGPQR